MLTQRGRQDILHVLFTQCLCSSSFLRHPALNISVTQTLFPPVLIKRSLFSPTQKALAKITVQTCHYHLIHHHLYQLSPHILANLSLGSRLSAVAYLWFQGFPSLTLTLSIIPHSLLRHRFLLLKLSAITQLSDFPKCIFLLSFIPPILPLLLISSSFFCVNFSVPSISELMSGL